MNNMNKFFDGREGKFEGKFDLDDTNKLEEKLESDNNNLKNHIKMLQDTIKNLKRDGKMGVKEVQTVQGLGIREVKERDNYNFPQKIEKFQTPTSFNDVHYSSHNIATGDQNENKIKQMPKNERGGKFGDDGIDSNKYTHTQMQMRPEKGGELGFNIIGTNIENKEVKSSISEMLFSLNKQIEIPNNPYDNESDQREHRNLEINNEDYKLNINNSKKNFSTPMLNHKPNMNDIKEIKSKYSVDKRFEKADNDFNFKYGFSRETKEEQREVSELLEQPLSTISKDNNFKDYKDKDFNKYLKTSSNDESNLFAAKLESDYEKIYSKMLESNEDLNKDSYKDSNKNGYKDSYKDGYVGGYYGNNTYKDPYKIIPAIFGNYTENNINKNPTGEIPNNKWNEINDKVKSIQSVKSDKDFFQSFSKHKEEEQPYIYDQYSTKNNCNATLQDSTYPKTNFEYGNERYLKFNHFPDPNINNYKVKSTSKNIEFSNNPNTYQINHNITPTATLKSNHIAKKSVGVQSEEDFGESIYENQPNRAVDESKHLGRNIISNDSESDSFDAKVQREVKAQTIKKNINNNNQTTKQNSQNHLKFENTNSVGLTKTKKLLEKQNTNFNKDKDESRFCAECNNNNLLLQKQQKRIEDLELINLKLTSDLEAERCKNNKFKSFAEEIISYYEKEYKEERRDERIETVNTVNTNNTGNTTKHKKGINYINNTNSNTNNNTVKKTRNKTPTAIPTSNKRNMKI